MEQGRNKAINESISTNYLEEWKIFLENWITTVKFKKEITQVCVILGINKV